MAAKKDTIRTIDVDGVTLDIDLAKLEDMRFTYALGKVSDDETPDAKKLIWYVRMLDLLLGDKAYSVMNQLAGEGTITVSEWSDFYLKVFEAVELKN